MQTIGKYRICGLLGRGGMSRVYKVEIPTIQKIAALKRLEPDPMLVDLVGPEKIRRLFVSEAVTMARLRHPNIVAVWDFDETGGVPFYLMEHYSHNLGEMIGETYIVENPSRTIPVDKALHYIRAVLAGLACLHYAGIVHRDIKPFNILITEQDTVKICDFGLSKLRGETFEGPSQLKVGSPWYAAPEQEADPNAASFSADVFSAGVMLYRMLTGALPMASPKAPSRLHPDLDAPWDDFVLKAIAPRPGARYGDASQMLTALADLETHWAHQKRLSPAGPAASPRPRGQQRHVSKAARRLRADTRMGRKSDLYHEQGLYGQVVLRWPHQPLGAAEAADRQQIDALSPGIDLANLAADWPTFLRATDDSANRKHRPP